MESVNFQINFAPGSDNPAKAVSHTFSSKLSKLYANIKKAVPLTFVVPETAPEKCYIRVTPLYQLVEYSSEVIHRCPTHVNPGLNGDRFITVDTESMPLKAESFYGLDPKGRVSLSVGYVPSSSRSFTITYNFNCLSSCRKGIRRRDMKLLFELVSYSEKYDIVHSFINVPLVVATCPGRDRARDERRLQNNKEEGPELNEGKISEYDFVDETSSFTQEERKSDCSLHETGNRLEDEDVSFLIEVDDDMSIEFIKTFCRGLQREV